MTIYDSKYRKKQHQRQFLKSAWHANINDSYKLP